MPGVAPLSPKSTSAEHGTVASFFAGIGGFDLGFEAAGFRTVFQSEIDPYCNVILEQEWPHIARNKDIKELSVDDIPRADIWCAGFPCQDVSLARARPRDGLRGARSGLFYDFAALLGDARPGTVILENVPGLLNSHEGRDFGIVIQTLVELGYGVAWRILNSKHFGVPQSRRRVYIVGCYNDPGRAAQILFEPERGEGHLEKGRKSESSTLSPFMERAEPSGRLRNHRSHKQLIGSSAEIFVPKLSFCISATTGRHTGTDWSRTYVAYHDRVRRLVPAEVEGLQGFPDGWTVPKGTSVGEDLDSRRYHALGNAVSVPVITWLAERVKATATLSNLYPGAIAQSSAPDSALKALSA
ncbi:DNA (cytosine-5-)-methyltransferase [Microbacterium limosum]|uniref:DNA (cytosine-5-)-methyltransferase n=1 Tax=Microbacterium limosum TaxID=3079935 RepID=A0AAU0MHC3_9MICO|nr:DNA (cytosine-5-)-methyltransferase [Microbacterium sp. Y20]WOQ69550.1 DNA (cytosine-5-)-methyltransferase [Microbacterium sp. Y20]